MTWATVATVGATIGSSLLGSSAAKKAAAAQAAAAQAAIAEQRRQFDQTREDYRPYRETGTEALGRLRGLQDFDPTPTSESVMNEPGYQFGLKQGRDALEGSAASRGGLYSGNALKELMQFGTDYGSTQYDAAWKRAQEGFGSRWNRLAGLTGLGMRATGSSAEAGQNYANSFGNITMGNANAQGAAKMQRAAIWGNALNSLGSAAGRWGGGGSPMRMNDPYRNPAYFGGDEGE